MQARLFLIILPAGTNLLKLSLRIHPLNISLLVSPLPPAPAPNYLLQQPSATGSTSYSSLRSLEANRPNPRLAQATVHKRRITQTIRRCLTLHTSTHQHHDPPTPTSPPIPPHIFTISETGNLHPYESN